MRIAKTKALISFAVTAKLICVLFSPMQIVGFPMRRLTLNEQLTIRNLFERIWDIFSKIRD